MNLQWFEPQHGLNRKQGYRVVRLLLPSARHCEIAASSQLLLDYLAANMIS